MQQISIVALRFAIGWSLFLQGYDKLVATSWSAASGLRSATGPFATLFHHLAEWRWVVAAADRVAVFGLVTLGLLLMLGLLTRTSSSLAVALLLGFLLVHPPLPLSGFGVFSPDGADGCTSRAVLEVLGLIACLAFDSGRIAGVDVLLHRWREGAKERRTAPE